jgi:hypothetical protein
MFNLWFESFVLTRFLHANRFPPVSAKGFAGPIAHSAAEALAKAASLENASSRADANLEKPRQIRR